MPLLLVVIDVASDNPHKALPRNAQMLLRERSNGTIGRILAHHILDSRRALEHPLAHAHFLEPVSRPVVTGPPGLHPGLVRPVGDLDVESLRCRSAFRIPTAAITSFVFPRHRRASFCPSSLYDAARIAEAAACCSRHRSRTSRCWS